MNLFSKYYCRFYWTVRLGLVHGMICNKQYCCRLYLQLQPGRLSCLLRTKTIWSTAVDSYQLGIFMSGQTREPCMPRSGDAPGQTGNWWTKTPLPSQVGPLYQVWITNVANVAAPGISIMLIKKITVIQYMSSSELWSAKDIKITVTNM